jgi:ribonuclease HI
MLYFTDGFTLVANPSSQGGGYTIMDENGTVVERKCYKRPGFTNNEGELLGLYRALEIAAKGDIIVSDSYVAISWVKGGRPRKASVRKDLHGLMFHCKALHRDKEISLEWGPRESNLAGVYNEEYPTFEESKREKPDYLFYGRAQESDHFFPSLERIRDL